MDFDFKKLSAREIQAADGATAASASAEPQDEGTSTEGEEASSSAAEPQDEGTSTEGEEGATAASASAEPQDEGTSSEEQQDVSAEEILSNLENSLGFGSLTR
jgi:hypothetical protein